MKSQMLYATLYGGISGLMIAAAAWELSEGDRVAALFIGVSALPFALFTAMRLNNRRLIRKLIAKEKAPMPTPGRR